MGDPVDHCADRCLNCRQQDGMAEPARLVDVRQGDTRMVSDLLGMKRMQCWVEHGDRPVSR
jgi:hypothetical protein